MNLQDDWGRRALQHATRITLASPGRGSATRAERRAAEDVLQHLTQLGIANAHRQPFVGLRSLWLFVAWASGFALLGHLAFWLLRPVLGDGIGWALATITFGWGFWLLWRRFAFQPVPGIRTLPHGDSQNVIAHIAPTGETRHKVVLTAHLDTHRAVIWFAHDALLLAYSVFIPLGLAGFMLAPLFYAGGLASGSAWLLGAGAAFALLHFIGWFTGMTADLGPYSPGANDNASAVGTVLALAERLQAEPLQHTAVWLVFTGCEETGCDGILAFLDAYGEDLRDALFLNFELVGIGDRLNYLRSEGMLRPQHIGRAAETWVQRAAAPLGVQPRSLAGLGVFTETGALWARGFEGVCLLGGCGKSPFLPEWHRLTDIPQKLETAALTRAHEAAWQMLHAVDVPTKDR
ncbi:MAG: hypothetical protein OHK0052_01860 [Anaerolineales bacterium]